MKINSIKDLDAIKREYEAGRGQHSVLVCGGAGCVSSDCAAVQQAVEQAVDKLGMADDVDVIQTGCIGTCALGPVMLLQPKGVFFTQLSPESAAQAVTAYLRDGEVLEQHTFYDRSLHRHVPLMKDIAFFNRQTRFALRNCGAMEHGSLAAYIARDGYMALARALDGSPRAVVDEIKASGLGGRGGAGFPTGVKWEAGLNAPGENKYIVCNADEGDPGAFMDRSIIEGDPHTLVEGMLLGGYAIGASLGYIYVRAEYPLAIQRLEKALDQAEEAGLLGDDILGTGFSFQLEIRIGAGAFVCGEETALLNSIEGRRGEPRQKPPFPFQRGLFDKPTIINNVETLANVPAILLNGAEWYAAVGTDESKGTKVFALAGDISNTGLVEVPIGTPLGDILFDIGGGIPDSKAFKAAQIGGPSGGCITPNQLNTPTDYNSLKQLGAIMGSGGLITMNEDACMVDTARYFMEFIREESCGKCSACRLGTKRMLEILERITQGQGREGDIELLQEVGETIKSTAICGLGQTAPNPVLSAIANFREEFEEHIHQKHCRAGVCSELFISPCENTCPAGVNVPGYTSLVAEGRFMDAYHLIRQENPFPSVCGRICTHPCESKCRRRTLDEAVAICSLKRFVADWARKHEDSYPMAGFFPRNDKRVAIIGAGAAGLTCGHYLSRIGYTVDVFESEQVAGGMLAYGIPEYRLPRDVLQHEIGLIQKGGVNIRLGTRVGDDIAFEKLVDEYDAVFVATGTQHAQKINLPGEQAEGVIHGIDFLKATSLGEGVDVGKKVVVIGGGNTAIDAARTALRLGAEDVSVVYRRNRELMPAYEVEVSEALEEGVKLLEMTSPLEFVQGEAGELKGVECQTMVFGEFDSTGRRRSVPAGLDSFVLECDTAIPAISQVADIPPGVVPGIVRSRWGTFEVDADSMMTSQPGVFAGGDIVHGPESVIQAIADGKKAAIGIDLYLGGRGSLNKGEPIDINPRYDDDEVAELRRYPLDMLDVDKRKQGFDEVVLGYHKLTAIAEAMRCLHCERRF